MSKTMRTSISVPLALKKRMDAAKEQINWSAIACRAFEEKLAEIASRKRRKTLDDVIQRLRGSKQKEEDEQYKIGYEAGRTSRPDRGRVGLATGDDPRQGLVTSPAATA
jgi:hypothetical protein